MRRTSRAARDRARLGGVQRGTGRMTAGALGIGSAVGAALTRSRPIGAAEARILGAAAVLLFALGFVGFRWPRFLSVPLAILMVWSAISLLARAWQLHRNANRLKVTAPQGDGTSG